MAAFRTGTPEAKVLEEIADALAKSGIELQMSHCETGLGQVRSLVFELQTSGSYSFRYIV